MEIRDWQKAVSVSEEMSIDLQFAMERKHEINKGRPYLHGGKVC